MRHVVFTLATLLLGSASAGFAQIVQPPPAATVIHVGEARVGTAGEEFNAPLLRQLISLDLHEARFDDALRAVSRQIGGRLMFDDAVTAYDHRVTLHSNEISAGAALRSILQGTPLEVVVSRGGSLILLKAPEPPAQDSVRVQGRVVVTSTGDPVSHVIVVVDEGRQRALTNQNGVFTLPRVPTGERVLTFQRIGYQTTEVALSLTAGRDTSLVVQLAEAPIRLSELVTTISGEQSRYEVGNSIPNIDVATEVQTHAYNNLSDLLAGRSLGMVTMSGGGSPNAPSRHRIRGFNSITGNNDPIVIIDGVRAVSGYARCAEANLRGCDNVPSRFDDLDINDIESIDILKGPSAAAMWGSEASNGVIVIKTKRGQPGETRWQMRYEEGFSHAPTDLRVPVQGLGMPANGNAVTLCTREDQALGRCVPIDSVAGGFNRYAHPRTTSMATGRTTDYGMSVSGGSESTQFYFSGGRRSDLGTAKMPEIDQRLVREALETDLPEWMVRPDARTNINFLSRLTGRFNDALRYSVTTSFVQIDSRSGGDGVVGATSDLRTEADTLELSRGWDQFHVERRDRTTRFVGSIALNWDPVEWFSGRAALGRDYAFGENGAFRRRNWCLPFCNPTSRDALGQVHYGERRQLMQTVDLGGTLRVPVLDDRVVLQTSFGAQHTRNKTQNFSGNAYDLPVGRIDFNAAPSANRTVTQSSDDRATFGTYLQQSAAIDEQLFLSVALRRDIGSALGTEVAPIFPKWSVSWLASEQPAFGLQQRGIRLRLRGAFGHAGVQPSTTAKYRSFGQLPRFVDFDGSFGSNYAYIGGVGNSELRPERTVESEGGFDLAIWNDRLTLDVTFFHKFTRDAIVSRVLAPSVGLNSTSRQSYNVGDVRNTGLEGYLTWHLIERSDVRGSIELGYATRQNELVSLGEGVEPFSITASNIDLTTAMHNDGVVMPGYPLFGRWARPVLGYSDTNGDGLITADEVRLGDALIFVGPSYPKADVSIRPHVSLWDSRVRVSMAFEYVHGITQLNQYAANTRHFTMATYDPNTPLDVQACYAAASPPHNNQYCFYETVNALRFRNLSIGLTLPDRLLGWFGAQSGSISILGSNLGLWTGYNGIDPMVNTATASGDRTLGGAVVPRGVTWSFRTNLTY